MKKVICISLSLMMLLTGFFSVLALQIGKLKFGNSENVTVNNTTITASASASIYYAKEGEVTGASEASAKYKGGAVFVAGVEQGQSPSPSTHTEYTMDGGIIKGQNAKYGGAIYISKDCTFIMNGGVIMNNSASFGGAIYVEKGGKCILNKGVIQDNTATNRGCDIYCEDPADLEVGPDFIIDRNSNDLTKMISIDTIDVGSETLGSDMHYIKFGSYPQTYVGSDMNGDLELWFSKLSESEKENIIKQYKTTEENSEYGTYGVFNSYIYTDGQIYARGLCNTYEEYPINYANGERVLKNEVVWLKVEPIIWIVLNYEDVMSKRAEAINLISYTAVSAGVNFNNDKEDENYNKWKYSNMRSWLNGEFYDSAFSFNEKSHVLLSNIKNNITNDYSNADSDGKGEDTNDYVYLLSYYEIDSVYFIDYPDSYRGSRFCSPSDFTLANKGLYYGINSVKPRDDGASIYWWTRSAGGIDSYVCVVWGHGYVNSFSDSLDLATGIRPSISLKIEPLAKISSDTVIMGNPNGTKDVDYKDMHYINFGTYPQTYVGCYKDGVGVDNVNLVNTTLINNLETFASNNDPIKYYTMQYEVSGYPEYGKWNAYRFTDGQVYARGISYIYDDSSNAGGDRQVYNYMNKTNPSALGPAIPVDGTVVWFKVEPIKWIVMNYEAVMNGTANTIDVLAYNALTAMVQFNESIVTDPLNSVWYANDGENEWSSTLRTWLNGEFLNTAFTIGEQNAISMKTNLNNWTENQTESTYNCSGHIENKTSVYSTVKGKTYNLVSQEKIYCLSFENYLRAPFDELENPWTGGGGYYTDKDYKRLCSPSDFARSNHCWTYAKEGSTYGTADYPNGGTCNYWTRSAGYLAGRVCRVNFNSIVSTDEYVTSRHIGVRPALSLSIR